MIGFLALAAVVVSPPPPPQFKRYPEGLTLAPRSPDAVPVEVNCQLRRSHKGLPEGDGLSIVRFELVKWASVRSTRGLQPTKVQASLLKYSEVANQTSGGWVRIGDRSLIDFAKDDQGSFTLVMKSFEGVSIVRQIGVSDDSTFVTIDSEGSAVSAGHCSILFNVDSPQ